MLSSLDQAALTFERYVRCVEAIHTGEGHFEIDFLVSTAYGALRNVIKSAGGVIDGQRANRLTLPDGASDFFCGVHRRVYATPTRIGEIALIQPNPLLYPSADSVLARPQGITVRILMDGVSIHESMVDAAKQHDTMATLRRSGKG
jgi:hypothetical protein